MLSWSSKSKKIALSLFAIKPVTKTYQQISIFKIWIKSNTRITDRSFSDTISTQDLNNFSILIGPQNLTKLTKNKSDENDLTKMTTLDSNVFHIKIKERLIESTTFLTGMGSFFHKSMSSFFLKSNENL